MCDIYEVGEKFLFSCWKILKLGRGDGHCLIVFRLHVPEKEMNYIISISSISVVLSPIEILKKINETASTDKTEVKFLKATQVFIYF